MIWFFRDFLDGWLYVVVSFLSLIFIMAILGFMMERKQLEIEKRNKTIVLNDNDDLNKITNNSKESNNVINSNNNLESNNNVARPKSVIPKQVLEKSINEGSNSKIPEILDLTSVKNNMNSK